MGPRESRDKRQKLGPSVEKCNQCMETQLGKLGKKGLKVTVTLPPFCSSLAPREAHCVVSRSWWEQMERRQKGANRRCSGPPLCPSV